MTYTNIISLKSFMLNQAVFLILVLTLIGKSYVLATDHNFEIFELVKNCDSEIQTSNFDGSCFLLGIKAQKKQNLQLFSKIEKLCIDIFAPKILENYEIFEDYLVYYPKCNYVILRKLASIEEKSFNRDQETKELVRFLNSH